jgi:mannose-1-phosphate guanylyltransferase
MQAVILAGGFGTRMRPLTYTTPKPLLPILNEPMIGRLIRTLPPEIDRVVLAVSYMVDRLREYFKEQDLGRDIILVEEKEPLGTGGAIKNVEKYIDDTFLAFNGDVICSLDLKAITEFHKEKKGTGTISMWEVEDPTRYGIMGMDSGLRVNRFLEKPKPSEVFSNWINAGVYVLEPEILDYMEPNKVISIEREVFPKIAEKGELFGFKFYGFWVDAGTPKAYLDAHRILLDKTNIKDYDIPKKVIINPPIMVGKNCTFPKNCELGPYTCLGDGVSVFGGAKIVNSVIMGDTKIGCNNILDGVIIGYGCTIEDEVRIGKEVVVGDSQVLKEGTDIPSNSKIGNP